MVNVDGLVTFLGKSKPRLFNHCFILVVDSNSSNITCIKTERISSSSVMLFQNKKVNIPVKMGFTITKLNKIPNPKVVDIAAKYPSGKYTPKDFKTKITCKTM
ncbi:hypothetical protein O9G_000507 [Rozella allomycis CSF55]|uniref:Uncharacterized protein n=1 Tax=Rozella allomycis (strain CSF55) TaxID=988480 RepID=A0A075AVZ1_ROZAC|nr:hypothetical protein O9G_000507 [Rozella allomycis CSF55]|eukprot:EPZ34320.1 hypothetical protein O9G_000507 [Rozella allomycis CSF55]